MNSFYRTIIISIIAILAIAPMVSAADRATLDDNDWDGLTSTHLYAGTRITADDLLDPNMLRHPSAVLPLPDGSVIVADTGNQVIKRITDGEAARFSGVNLLLNEAGLPVGALEDGPPGESSFNSPMGLDMDADGNIYVADAANHAIRKISPDGTVTTIAGDGVIGLQDGPGEQARFYHPSDVAVAPDGTVYVADTLNHVIRRIDANGTVTTLNKPSERVVEVASGVITDAGDYRDGRLANALFNEPSGLAIDEQGNLYVSDTGNQRIRYIDLSRGFVTTVAGGVFADAASGELYEADALYAEGFHRDGAADQALFFAPKGIALTEAGGLLIADSENHVIRYLKDGQVTTVVGQADEQGYQNGIEGYTWLYRPMDVAITADGVMLIADSYNNVIRQVKLYELPDNVESASHIQIIYEDHWIEFDTEPEIVNGRTMVPVRFIAEAIGYEVGYVDAEEKVTLANSEQTIEFYIGQQLLTVRNAAGEKREVDIDVSSYVKNSRTYVPVRFFSEIASKDVTWIQDEQLVIIRDRIVE